MAKTILITGSRTLTSSDVCMKTIFDNILEDDTEYIIIHGDAIGADKLATNEASKRKNVINIEKFIPQWNIHGRSAGLKRNTEMVMLNPDIIIGFLKNKSPGTVHCLKEIVKNSSKLTTELIYLWHDRNELIMDHNDLREYLKSL